MVLQYFQENITNQWETTAMNNIDNQNQSIGIYAHHHQYSSELYMQQAYDAKYLIWKKY